MTVLTRKFRRASELSQWRRRFNLAYDKLVSDLYFSSETESVTPTNVHKTRESFSRFLEEMDWIEAHWCFQDLLEEKRGEFAYRADGFTPNWYHEFRQCLYFLTMIRNGCLKESDLRRYGGCDVAIGTILRHDSWEDLGKDRVEVFSALEKRIYAQEKCGFMTNTELYCMLQKAVKIANGMDCLTRKTPVLNEEGVYLRKADGKLFKKDRFADQLNLYFDHVLQSPLTVLSKFFDGIEGMSTRVGVSSFTVEDNKKYTEERRMIYSRRNLDGEAIKKFPFLKDSIRGADSMLGILVIAMEAINDYGPGGSQKPEHAKPISIDHFLKKAKTNFNGIPPGFHPISILIERLRTASLSESNNRLGVLMRTSIVPALSSHFGQITIYTPPVECKVSDGLPRQSLSAPNVR